ncbi:hypothetical protein MASR2M79_21950 [Aminivibrio sp.]
MAHTPDLTIALYIAKFTRPCGHKVVGLSMGGMTERLVINALEEAYHRSGRPRGTLIHSDVEASIALMTTGKESRNMDLSAACPEKATAGTTPMKPSGVR